MSSVQDKNSGATKSFFLLRRCSIDKIKCSAYPILGSIFEKKSSLIHAFQKVLMNPNLQSSRMADIIIPAMQFLCLAMTSTLKLIRKHVGGVSLENLEKNIHEFNQHKLRRKRSHSKEIKECNDIKQDAISTEKDEKFYDCLTAPASTTTTPETETETSVVIKSARLLKFSYGLCLAVVYSQLTMLMYMAGFCAFKLGFLFLLACVATIAYFVLKISFLKKAQHRHGRKGKRHCRVPSAHQIGKAITFCRPIAFVIPQIRLNISENLPLTGSGEEKQKLL